MKDVEFERLTLIAREGKGGVDQAVMPQPALVPSLREQLAHSNTLRRRKRNQKSARRHV